MFKIGEYCKRYSDGVQNRPFTGGTGRPREALRAVLSDFISLYDNHTIKPKKCVKSSVRRLVGRFGVFRVVMNGS